MIMILIRLVLLRVLVLVPLMICGAAAAAATADATIVTMLRGGGGGGGGGGGEQQHQHHTHAHAHAHAHTHRLLATAYNAADSDSNSTVAAVMDTTKESFTTFRQNIQTIISTNPKEWTTMEIIIVIAVILSFWTLLLSFYICCIGCCKAKKLQKMKTNTNHHKKKKEHDMVRPYVKRMIGTPGSVVPPLISNFSSPSELAYGNNLNLDATDINKLPLGVRLHGAVQLRRQNLEGQNIRIAVIDSGIDSSHPGFHGSINSEKYWFRYGTPLSQDDHGTHVAGTIHFMAPQAELYDYRVFGEEGDIDGNMAVAKSIRHAVDITKCHIINMSLSVGYPVRTEIQKAIQYAYKKGVHMVCAAGNDGDGNPTTDEIYCYPAIYKETISIAAVQKEDGFLLDATNFSESNSSINYSGIGSNVVSLKPGGGIQTMSGTSMASPHITGLIACLLSNDNNNNSTTKYNITDKKLRALLDTTYVIDIGEEGYDKQTGKGFLSYLAANDKDDFIDLLSMVAN